MRSKTSYFSPAIFKNNISRFWLLVVCYLIAQCVALPLVLQVDIGNNYYPVRHSEQMYSAIRIIYQTLQITNVIALFGACASAMAVFSYMYSARSANMMAALPVRREGMFFSACGSIYAVVIACNLFAVLMGLCVGLMNGVGLSKWLFEWFLVVMAQFTIYFGIAVLCANLTGSIIAMPLMYFVANFFFLLFGQVVISISNEVIYGFNNGVPDIFMYLTPFGMMINYNCRYTGPSNVLFSEREYQYLVYECEGIGWYALAGVVFIAIAFFLHKRRMMETAGDVVAVKFLRPLFKIFCALSAGFGGGMLFYTMFLQYLGKSTGAYRLMGSVFVIGAIGYVLSEMLVRKTTRVPVKSTSISALALAAAMALTVLALDADLLGIEKRVPEASEITEVTISTGGEGLTYSDIEGIEAIRGAHQIILDNKTKNETDHLNHDMSVHLTYMFADGSQLRRYYQVKYTTEGEATPEAVYINELMNSPESILQRKTTDIPMEPQNIVMMRIHRLEDAYTGEWKFVEFTAAEAWELYNQCIYPDMLDGTIGLVNVGNSAAENVFYNNEIEIHLFSTQPPEGFGEPRAAAEYYYKEGVMVTMPGGQEGYEERFYTYPTPDSFRTNAWLESHGIKLTEMF